MGGVISLTSATTKLLLTGLIGSLTSTAFVIFVTIRDSQEAAKIAAKKEQTLLHMQRELVELRNELTCLKVF